MSLYGIYSTIACSDFTFLNLNALQHSTLKLVVEIEKPVVMAFCKNITVVTES